MGRDGAPPYHRPRHGFLKLVAHLDKDCLRLDHLGVDGRQFQDVLSEEEEEGNSL